MTSQPDHFPIHQHSFPLASCWPVLTGQAVYCSKLAAGPPRYFSFMRLTFFGGNQVTKHRLLNQVIGSMAEEQVCPALSLTEFKDVYKLDSASFREENSQGQGSVKCLTQLYVHSQCRECYSHNGLKRLIIQAIMETKQEIMHALFIYFSSRQSTTLRKFIIMSIDMNHKTNSNVYQYSLTSKQCSPFTVITSKTSLFRFYLFLPQILNSMRNAQPLFLLVKGY